MAGREEVVDRASCAEGMNASIASRDSNVKSISPVVFLLVQYSPVRRSCGCVESFRMAAPVCRSLRPRTLTRGAFV